MAGVANRLVRRPNLINLVQQSRCNSTGYYVLLPEVPPDTAGDNAVMRHEEHPQFRQINPDKIITGCSKLAIQYDVELGKHIESLKDADTDLSFDAIFHPIEKKYQPMNTAWRTAKNLNYTCGGHYRTAFQRVHPQVERARNERWISEDLFNIVKTAKNLPNLSEVQHRLIDMYLMEGKLNGIELTGDDKRSFIETLGKLVDSKNHFRNRVMLSTNIFSHLIHDFDDVSEMPQHIAANLAKDRLRPQHGPWRITLQQHSVDAVLKYCPNRSTRWNIWYAYNNRASISQDDQNLSNHNIIKDLRESRQDLSDLLGFENFAQMSMQTKMAGNVKNVLHMIESFRIRLAPVLKKQFEDLKTLAAEDGVKDLKPWDVYYYRRKLADKEFNLDDAVIAQYFPFETVLERIFGFFNKAFNIKILEHTGEVDTWNSDVRFFKIYDCDSQKELASFYADFWKRNKKIKGAWMEVGREHSALTNCKPFSYLNMSINKPSSHPYVLLTLNDVQTLMFELGHGLQQLLTTAEYSELAGQRNIEWDAVQAVPMLFSKLLYTPYCLEEFSCHHSTKEQLPEDYIQSIIGRQNHFSSLDLMRQLYLSAFDLEMNIGKDHWYSTMKRLWSDFMPIAHHDDDNHPCWMTSIFSDFHSAAYYSFVWSDMMAADLKSSFIDGGLENEQHLRNVGIRLRETLLSTGGSVSSSEVFRRFQGRDPSHEHLLNDIIRD